MLRGEFIMANGLVIPNNITTYGAAAILAAAFRGEAMTLWVGLCDAVPDLDLQVEEIAEPTIATNGYARQQLAVGTVDWPTVGTLNNESYVESDWITFAALGGAFDEAIRRMFLAPSETATTGDLFCLSAALPALLTIDEATPEADRKFKYRVYLR